MEYQLDFRRYRLPFRAPVRTAHGLWSEREGFIVRLEAEDGRVGFGEAAPISWFGTETVEAIEPALRTLGKIVTDEHLDAIPAALGCLRNAMGMGRATERHEPVHGTLGVATMIGAGRAALPQIGPKAEIGFRVFKWKVGVGDVADELALFDDVCARLPEGGKLRLDANGAWDRRTAERWLARCAERPVEFVEQPCFAAASAGETQQRRADDLLRGLAEDFPTPIALDESLVGEGDVERWIGAGWRGVYVVKPSLMADPEGALRQLETAKASVVFSSALETGVGAQAALRRALAWKGEPRALGFGVWPLFADARFDGPHLAPFLRASDVERLNPEAVWTALS